MAKATLKITCAQCGNTFVHSRTCYNRRDADDYEDWAIKHITICPTCYRRNREESTAAKASAIIAELNIPSTIDGVSDNQVAYAHKVRNDYIVKNADHMRETFRWLALIDSDAPEFLDVLTQNNWTRQQAIDRFNETNRLDLMVLISSDARSILDMLAVSR